MDHPVPGAHIQLVFSDRPRPPSLTFSHSITITMSYQLDTTDQPDKPTYADIVRKPTKPIIERPQDRDQWVAIGPSAEEWLKEEPPFTQGVNELDAAYRAEKGQEDNWDSDSIEKWREQVAMDMEQGEQEAEWAIGENENEGSEWNEEEEEEVVESLLQE